MANYGNTKIQAIGNRFRNKFVTYVRSEDTCVLDFTSTIMLHITAEWNNWAIQWSDFSPGDWWHRPVKSDSRQRGGTARKMKRSRAVAVATNGFNRNNERSSRQLRPGRYLGFPNRLFRVQQRENAAQTGVRNMSTKSIFPRVQNEIFIIFR